MLLSTDACLEMADHRSVRLAGAPLTGQPGSSTSLLRGNSLEQGLTNAQTHAHS